MTDPSSNRPRTRILLVEDQAGVRRALCAALRAHDIDVVGTFGDGESALAAAATLDANVALVDLGLPGISGIETIRGLRSVAPSVCSLVLTVFETAEAVVQAIEAGASGYLLKGASTAEIRDAIEQVRDGLAPVSPAVASHLLKVVRSRAEASPVRSFNLTAREGEVLGFLVRGHSYLSIARMLGVQLGTVQGYVKNVYRKLEVSSKAEATFLAVTHGLVPRD